NTNMYLGARGASASEAEPQAEVRLDEASSRQMAERVIAAWQRAQQANAEFSSELQRFDLVHGCAVDGSITTAAWMRSNLHMTGSQAAQQLVVARQLERLPQAAAAYESAQISYQHAAVIAGCAKKVGAEVIAEHEATLVECATQVDPYTLSRATEHLEHMVDPDGALSFFEQQHERRTLQLHRAQDGMYTLRGVFDREGGATVAGGLEALMTPLAADDWRTAGQRRADALVEAFSQHSESPQLTVITTPGTLRGEPGSPAGEIRDQLTLPSEVVRRIACDCRLQEGHVCADGVNVHLSDETRIVAPKMKRQLELRDGGCRFPGCSAPPPWCDAHHLEHWVNGGKTKLSNLVLLCRRHHMKAHEGAWALSWAESGELLAQPP
ncbi:MAG TPA: DUF222 domain-containing protein, partial [Candidatus Dormibacteraeota bacterium]